MSLDYSYRDVSRTSVEDFDFATGEESEVPAWLSSKAHLWMCGASDCESLAREECEREQSFEDLHYIPDPFPEE